MPQRLAILALLALIVALPFALRRQDATTDWRPGDPVVVVAAPMTQASRTEFGQAFARWHRAHHGRPAKVDWRVVGGATDITRYLEAQYLAAFKAWWSAQGHAWPAGGEAILDRKFNPSAPPPEVAADPARLERWRQQRDAYVAFRNTDDPAAFSSKIDLFFGGGTFEHLKAGGAGLAVPAWPPEDPPPDTLRTADGRELIPEALGGETWRGETFCGAALSTFGICYNTDRLRDLGLDPPPRRWADLTHPALIGQVGLADPTKSGSIAKAFEMIVQEQCAAAVRDAGFTDGDVARCEGLIRAANLPPGSMPDGVPAEYQAAVEAGWLAGVRLVQRIGANARYFTAGADKVPIDVSVGDAAAGLAIDFYGRYQAQMSRAPDGTERMVYVTPAGGSSVSADPISLLRGAEHREVAQRFIAFVLSADGQKLWNYAPGTPGGPERYALRRLPIRRDFYPAADTNTPSAYAEHRAHYSDDLGSPAINPYVLAASFTYQPRWTGAHFGVLRDLVRAMCLDSGDELRGAWGAIVAAGGPTRQPEAMAMLARLPERPVSLTWSTALTIPRDTPRLEDLREWTVFFRASYVQAGAEVEKSKGRKVEKSTERSAAN